MKLKQPILFHSIEELQEAVIYNVIEKAHIALYEAKEYSLPTLFWNDTNTRLDHVGGSERLLDKNDEYLYILRESIDWSDIKDKYKPKEWYEKESSRGKLIWVSDNVNEGWVPAIFKYYDDNSDYSFVCYRAQWKFARPVLTEEIINLEGE